MLQRHKTLTKQKPKRWYHRLHWLNHPGVNYGSRAGGVLLLLLFGGLLLGKPNLGITASLGMIAALISGLDETKPRFWRYAMSAWVNFFAFTLLTLITLKLQIPALILFIAISFICALFTLYGPLPSRLGIANLFLVILTYPNVHLYPIYQLPLLYLLGAILYTLIGWLWQHIWPYKELRENMAKLYQHLGNYCHSKLEFMLDDAKDPQALVELQQQLTKLLLEGEILLRNLGGNSSAELKLLRQLFFLASELQELLCSTSHATERLYPLYRDPNIRPAQIQLMHTYAEQFSLIADALLNYRPLQHVTTLSSSLNGLQQKLAQAPEALQEIAELASTHLEYTTQLIINLRPAYRHSLAAPPKGPAWCANLWQNMTWQSATLRYAVRYACCMGLGFIVGEHLGITNSYWILMTISIVMQADYVSTKSKAMQRATGTLIGLGLSVLLIAQNPPLWLTLLLISIISPTFYAFIRVNYSVAVIGITLFVMLQFHLLRQPSFDFVIPRLLDTFIGCALAIMSNLVLWPQWQSNRLKQQIRLTLERLDKLMCLLFESYAGNELAQMQLEHQRILVYQAQNELLSRYQQALREPMHSRFYLQRVKGIALVTQTLLNQFTNMTLLAKQSIRLPRSLLLDLRQQCEMALQTCEHHLNDSSIEWPQGLHPTLDPDRELLPSPKQRQIHYQCNLVVNLLRELFEQLQQLSLAPQNTTYQ